MEERHEWLVWEMRRLDESPSPPIPHEHDEAVLTLPDESETVAVDLAELDLVAERPSVFGQLNERIGLGEQVEDPRL